MSHVLRIGVVDQIAYFRAFDTDGSGKADLTSATTGLALSVFRTGLAAVSIASLTDKAADNTAHADGAIRQVAGNLYTVDLPDAATANQCPSIGVRGSYTGGVIEPVPHPIVNYDPSLAAVGANTVTPPTTDQISDKIAADFAAGSIDDSSEYFIVYDAIAFFSRNAVLNRMLVGNHDVPGSLGYLIPAMAGAGFDTATDSLVEIKAAVEDGGSGVVGPGGVAKEITVQSGGQPIDGAAVWITTDLQGNNIVAGVLYSNSLGKVSFMLETSITYYVWVQKARVNFTNPTSFVIPS